jgi:hypothetical protein
MRRFGSASLLASRTSRERNLICAMITSQILEPASKLAFTRWWENTTIPHVFGINAADEDELNDAMDWLLERQPIIEAGVLRRPWL